MPELIPGGSLTVDYGIFGCRIITPAYFSFWIGPFLAKSFTITNGSTNMNLSLGDNEMTTAHLAQTDADGNPTPFVKAPTWAVDNGAILTLTPVGTGVDTGGTASCTIAPTNPPGTPSVLGVATITVTNTDNPNITPLTITVTVAAEAPTTMTATFDTPTERTTPTPAAGKRP